jgi:hypothetical protein
MWSRVAGAFRRPLTLLYISFHRCSIGDKSGLYGGQSSGLMLWLARKSWQTLATWGRALSCWKIRWCCCTLFRPDGRRRAYRRHGKRFADACVLERDRFGGGSVMVWGGISHGLKSPLIMTATFAMCTSERKTNVRSTSSQTKLAQSVSHSFWVNVGIMIAYRN